MNGITSSKRLIHKLRLFLLTFDMLTFFINFINNKFTIVSKSEIVDSSSS